MAVGQIISRAIATGAIGADQIATGAITAADIPAGEITADKLHTTLDFSTKTFTMANAHVTQAMVTQHQSALSVTESQVSDLQSYVLPNTSPTFTNTTLTGYLAGPASFVIDPAGVGDNTGTVVIAGNLQVDGTQTTINSTTVSIDDLKLSVATDAADSAAANGAGITVGGANANITYTHATTSWDFDKPVNVTGTVTATGGTMTGDVNFGDNNKAIFGAGSDLQIYHDGSDSYVNDVGDGALILKGGTQVKLQASNGENALIVNDNGAVWSYYDNDLKLATTATGIDVTGTVTSDGLTVNTGTSNTTATFQSTDAGAYINFTDTTGTSGIGNETVYLYLDVDKDNVVANSQMRFRVDGSSKVIIKDNGNVGIGETNPQYQLHLSKSGANYIQIDNDTNSVTSFLGVATDHLWLGTSTNHQLKFYANSDIKMVIDTNGNVGIGTSSPAQKLEVAGTAKADQYLLDAVAKDISDTAVDVFIYDTRKDSDGGAWRKRTQHTSWYNETLNTATRGARKEFPAVAVIVAESTQLTIYDGDDPDLLMWMVFDRGGTAHNTDNVIGSAGDTMASVTMLNGIMAISTNAAREINFISEKANRYSTSGAKPYRGNIAERNSGKGTGTAIASLAIVNNTVNDVAMTVLPNAPIDAATGLPVPTIAVATNGGVSVIKDDGTVVDITASAGSSYNGVSFVDISENYYLIFEQDSDTNSRSLYYIPIPPTDTTTSTNDGDISDKVVLKFYDNGAHVPYPTFNGGGVLEAIKMSGDNQALRSNVGDGGAGYSETNMLTLLEPSLLDKEQGRVAYITADHNTGWMTGDNRLATLSDTDTTNISGTEILTNGDFSSGTTGWTILDSNEGSISASGGQLTLNNTTTANPPVGCYQAISLTVGKHYTLETDHASGQILAGNIVDAVNSNGGSDGYGNVTYHDVAGTKRRTTFRATSQTNYVVLRVNTNATGTTVMNSVSITEAEPDRGPYSRHLRDRMSGLKPIGTVTKSAVATGANLVGYTNFTSSNYFLQHMPWNIGTGDFSFMFWVKPPSSLNGYFHCISIGTESTSGQNSGTGITLKLNAADSSPYFYTNAGGGDQGTFDATNNKLTPNGWNQIVGGRKGGVFYIYINGRLTKTGNSNSFNISDTFLTMGRAIGMNENDENTSLALVRISKTFPSANHINKIYEDEKFLFQENAKATLYGSSDAVTALAYDDDTELLHVGTSAGRSVFRGLRRIDNTTDAVGAAISASNGMVAED